MQYRICPDCKQHIDHGERCDCKKKEAAPLQRKRPHDQINKPSLTDAKPGVKLDAILTADLKKLLDDNNIPSKAAVKVVATRFKSFDKTLLSKCMKPEKYGVVIHPDGFTAIAEEFCGFSAKPEPWADVPQKRDSGHKLKCRISCRLPDSDYEELKKHISDDGFESMQDWIAFVVQEYLAGKEGKRDV